MGKQIRAGTRAFMTLAVAEDYFAQSPFRQLNCIWVNAEACTFGVVCRGKLPRELA